MDKNNSLLEIYYISGLLGVLLEFLGSVQISYIVFIVLIFIDTITGMTVAIKHHRFKSAGLVKFSNKLITYSLSIFTVRLLEIGFLTIFETTILSQIILAFLQVVETISILENLTFLGVPNTSSLKTLLINHLKIPGITDILKNEKLKKREVSEIDDIIKYYIPSISNIYLQKMVYIRAKSCKYIALQLDNIFKEKGYDNNELLYYKLMLLTELSCKDIKEKCKEEVIPKEYFEKFNEINEEKTNMWVKKVKAICFSGHSAAIKKEELMDTIIILLYKIILEVNRQDS